MFISEWMHKSEHKYIGGSPQLYSQWGTSPKFFACSFSSHTQRIYLLLFYRYRVSTKLLYSGCAEVKRVFLASANRKGVVGHVDHVRQEEKQTHGTRGGWGGGSILDSDTHGILLFNQLVSTFYLG